MVGCDRVVMVIQPSITKIAPAFYFMFVLFRPSDSIKILSLLHHRSVIHHLSHYGEEMSYT